jgi:hypothetical protein
MLSNRNKAIVEWMRGAARVAPDPEWIDPIWEKPYQDLKELLMVKNPHDFLQWEPIRKTMHMGAGKAAASYLRSFEKIPGDYWHEIAEEHLFGNPCIYNGTKWSPTTVKHAVHLHRFQKFTGRSIPDNFTCIFEFGAGYGSMCRLIRRMGFKGDYVIYDMPLVCILQKFYLEVVEVDFTWTDSDLLGLTYWLARHHPGNCLFIATFSMDEAPIKARYLTQHMVKEFGGIMIAYHSNYSQYDNRKHFTEIWKNGMEDYHWVESEVEENKQESHYLFGVKNG